MNQDTQNKFAAILASAQSKVNATTQPIQAKFSQPKQQANELPKDEIKMPEMSNFTFDTLIADIKPEEITPQPIKAALQIIDYSERAIAVIGETKVNKERLGQLGGKFNKYLKCGAGWIFPKTKETLIRNTFNI